MDQDKTDYKTYLEDKDYVERCNKAYSKVTREINLDDLLSAA